MGAGDVPIIVLEAFGMRGQGLLILAAWLSLFRAEFRLAGRRLPEIFGEDGGWLNEPFEVTDYPSCASLRELALAMGAGFR